MTKSQTEFFKMLDRKIDEVCVIPLPPFCVHVVVFFPGLLVASITSLIASVIWHKSN